MKLINLTQNSNTAEKEMAISAAIKVGKKLLGSALSVRGKRYYLCMLELYFGSAGDDAHDWHRAQHSGSNGSMLLQTAAQLSGGFALYLNSTSDNPLYRFRRMDIVIGAKNTACSLLVRNVIDDKGNYCAKRSGAPNKIISSDCMDICSSDHGKPIPLVASESAGTKICLIDTHDEFFRLNHLSTDDIVMRKRYHNGFNGTGMRYHDRLWNLSISPANPRIPHDK